MEETLKPNIPFTPNSIGRNLPTTRANILHTFGQKKTVNYELFPAYKGIKIPPKILYKLQSGNTNFTIDGNLNSKQKLIIMNGKLILTDTFYKENEGIKLAIKSCIETPIDLNNPDKKPSFHKYIKYNREDYFLLSFLNPAINGRGQETFVLVSYKHGEGLKAKKIGHVQFVTNTEIKLNNIDGVPTLLVTHEEPDSADEYGTPKYQHGEYQYTETFDLKNQERKIEKKYEEYA